MHAVPAQADEARFDAARHTASISLALALHCDYALCLDLIATLKVGTTKLAFTICAIAMSACALSIAASQERPEVAATSAAEVWLALVDAGSYAESWHAASTLFRQAIPQEQWQARVAHARAPLGALRSRQVRSATFKHTLPEAPDGEYVVIQFASSFANKAAAIETVTPMKDADGTWRVSGYYIK
jgi:hypothetical protein